MNKKRLLTLANFLETNPTVNTLGKFHLSVWMVPYQKLNLDVAATNEFMRAFNKFKRNSCVHSFISGDHESFIEGEDNTIEPIDCKTVGCAIGWATTIPEFKKAGLHLKHSDYKISSLCYNNYKDYEACAKFFDISEKNAINIFSPIFYERNERHDPLAITKRIKNFTGIFG